MAHSGLIAAFEQYRPELLRFLHARTGSSADAEDVASDLFIKLRTVSPDRLIAIPRNYLMAMANNLVRDRLRESRRRVAREERWTAEQVGPLDRAAIDGARTPEEESIARDEAERLRAAISRLPAKARHVLVLHKIDGLSHCDIASRLGIGRSAVEKHMAVAMAHLRRAFAELR